jgi:putative transposase
MRLVYKYNINSDNSLLNLCLISKNLYNQALYEINQSLKNDNKFLFYSDLDKIMKSKTNLENEINYKLLKAQTSQQTLKVLEKDIKSYIKSSKDFAKNPSKYKGKPNLPKYKRKYNQLIYTNQCSTIKEGYIHLSKQLKIAIPQWDKYKDIIKNYNQIRIIPKSDYIVIEIVYEVENKNLDLNYESFSSIDLGINNLVTLITEDNKPLLFNGRQIKALNQGFNRRLSKLQSIKDLQKITKTTKQIRRLYGKRENTLNDLFHKLSRIIVNYLVSNKVGNLIIGYNEQWKDSISLGKKMNQKFVQIPYLKLLNFLKYKCEMVGIRLTLTEESYTSKCDSLSLEKVCKHDSYSGDRIERGLFQSSTGKLLNADVNGGVNIMRKVVDDSYVSKIINRGLLFNPIKVDDLYNMNSKLLLKEFN